MTETTLRLSFGLNWGYPEDAKALWGARLITDGARLDFVFDRQSCVGDEVAGKELVEHFNKVKAYAKVREVWDARHHELYHETAVTKFYEDDKIVVIGSTNNSYGYLYITAYLK
jgi:hypothetical protein